MRKKHIVGILWEQANDTWFSKDMCAYPYYLANKYDWNATLCYFAENESLINLEYQKKVSLVNLGCETNYQKKLVIAKNYIKRNFSEIDVVMLFNYGGNTYKLANYIKKVNPNIFVWSKLDMNRGGFSHFYDGTRIRKIKNYVELWKSRNVDLFTVETFSYYKVLKDLKIFNDRIGYLPNGVALFPIKEININQLDNIKKENIIVYIGRLDCIEKNAELFLNSLTLISNEVLSKWKIKIIGPYSKDIYNKHIMLGRTNIQYKENVELLGKLTNRRKVYELCSSARIICLTSRSESFGIAVIEGMYFGTYPVLTNYGKIVKDVTNDGNIGTVVYENNANTYAKALEMAMKNVVSNTHLCEECREYARKTFSYNILVDKLYNLLKN